MIFLTFICTEQRISTNSQNQDNTSYRVTLKSRIIPRIGVSSFRLELHARPTTVSTTKSASPKTDPTQAPASTTRDLIRWRRMEGASSRCSVRSRVSHTSRSGMRTRVQASTVTLSKCQAMADTRTQTSRPAVCRLLRPRRLYQSVKLPTDPRRTFQGLAPTPLARMSSTISSETPTTLHYIGVSAKLSSTTRPS